MCRNSAGQPLDVNGNVVSNVANAAPASSGCKHGDVAGVQATKVAPTQSSGTLPFTGAELGVFAIVGLLLIASGVVLRLTGRRAARKFRPAFSHLATAVSAPGPLRGLRRFSCQRCPPSYSQPFSSASRAASARVRAPSFCIAEER